MSAAEVGSFARAFEAPDDVLVARARRGDASAYALLMRRYNRRVYRAVRAILDDEMEVEDAMQDAYLAAYRHLSRFEGRARFSTWLIRIAVNAALDRRRRSGRALRLDAACETAALHSPLAPAAEGSIDPERLVGAQRLAVRLEEAIHALPDAYRAVYVLRELEGLGTFATAECLQIEEATVRTRFHRARRLLRDALGAEVTAAAEVMPFGGERCARIVARVIARID
jgi:RNA polymerase sigma-70 factor (ECF subfamily)